MSPAGYFLPTAAESTQRTPSKPMVLKSFARLGYRPYGKPSATRTGCVRLSPCLRIVSASTPAGRLRGPARAWRGGEGCYVYRAAGCGHTPPPITHRPPPGRARRPCPTKISCRAAPMCAAADYTIGWGRAPPLRRTRGACGRAVGEISEALPVVEEAS